MGHDPRFPRDQIAQRILPPFKRTTLLLTWAEMSLTSMLLDEGLPTAVRFHLTKLMDCVLKDDWTLFHQIMRLHDGNKDMHTAMVIITKILKRSSNTSRRAKRG